MITIVFGVFQENQMIADRIVEYHIEDENVKTFVEFILNESKRIADEYDERVHINVQNLIYERKD